MGSAIREEKHELYYRPNLKEEPVEAGAFPTYRAALMAGMRECGHGNYWVESYFRSADNLRWTVFVPEQPTRLELGLEH